MASSVDVIPICEKEKLAKGMTQGTAVLPNETEGMDTLSMNNQHVQEGNAVEVGIREPFDTISSKYFENVIAEGAQEMADEPHNRRLSIRDKKMLNETQNTSLRDKDEVCNNEAQNAEFVICVQNLLGLSSSAEKRARVGNVMIDHYSNSGHMNDAMDGERDHIVNLCSTKRLKCETIDSKASADEVTFSSPMEIRTPKSGTMRNVQGVVAHPSPPRESGYEQEHKDFRCDRCAVLCTSEVDFRNHLNGKRHARMCKNITEKDIVKIDNEALRKDKELIGGNCTSEIFLTENGKKLCFEPLITSLISLGGRGDSIVKALNLGLAAIICPGVESMNKGNDKNQSPNVDFRPHNLLTMHSLCLLNMMKDLRTARLEDLLRSSSSVTKENEVPTISFRTSGAD